jgi:hypothetical protein
MDDIIRMARKHGKAVQEQNREVEYRFTFEGVAALLSAERNKLAAWMIAKGYATGHGDTTEGLLEELRRQVRESEREAMLRLALLHGAPWHFQEAIRARGKA